MENYFIVDSHAHIFPTKVANKAVKAIGDFYGLKMAHDGSTQSLISSGDKIGVRKYIVHSTATRPDQVPSINNFIHKKCTQNPSFIGFGTLHPDLDDFEAEISHIINLGLKGIKLHPEFQAFPLDTSKAQAMFAAIGNKLPVLVHLGDSRFDTSSPRRLANVLDANPELLVIGAHLGGYTAWNESLQLLVGRKNLYLDTSSSLAFLDKEKAAEIIRKHGVHKILFGVDYPMWDHFEELQRFLSLPLNNEERKLILGENARLLFKII